MKFVDELNHIDTQDDDLWNAEKLPALEGAVSNPQANKAADSRRKALVHFWNESLRHSQRTQANFDLMLRIASKRKTAKWWLDRNLTRLDDTDVGQYILEHLVSQ